MFSVNFSQERENQTNGLQTVDLTPMMTSVGDREAACFLPSSGGRQKKKK